MEASVKNKISAWSITLVVHIALLLLLMMVVLSMPDPPLTGGEGMVVNLGYVDESTGDIQPMSDVTTENPMVENIVSTSQPEVDENILTQDNEASEAIVVNKTTSTRQDKVEVKDEATSNIKVTEPVKTVDPRALYKGKTNNSTSQGTGDQGTGDQGSRDGDPFSSNYGQGGNGNTPGHGGGGGGASYNLAGRKSKLLPPPEYNIQEQGIVVVEITVDKEGNVTNAKAGVKGSTTTNAYLLERAKRAALGAKFNADPQAREEQKGTIVYNFVLK